MRTAVSRAGSLGKNILQNMGNILSLLEVNPTMPASELRSHIVKHLPPHQSVTAQYIVNFRKKAITYLAINGKLLSKKQNYYSNLRLVKKQSSQTLLSVGKG